MAGGLNLKNRLTGGNHDQEAGDSAAAKKDTLKWYAAKARREGKSSATVAAPIVEYLGSADDPEFVLSNYSAVIAQPIESKTVAVDEDKAIVTWYKFRRLETLRERPARPNLPAPTILPPQELLPLDEDDFLVVKYGGSVDVDGMNVSMVDPDFPPFQINNRYLLFISMLPAGVAHIWAGPTGTFRVMPDDSIEPVNKTERRMKAMLRTRFGNSVGSLKEHLGKNR